MAITARDELIAEQRTLPVGSAGHRASGWWGLLCVIATEGALFAYLLMTYFYCTLQAVGPWPLGGKPGLHLAGPNTVILLASSVAIWWGERGIRRGKTGQLVIGLVVSLVLGSVFAGIQLKEWLGKPFSFSSGTYGSLFFTITGFHLAHVVAGLVILLLMLLWSALGYFDSERHVPISIGALYWHFVDGVWLFVFTSLYLTPYLGLGSGG